MYLSISRFIVASKMWFLPSRSNDLSSWIPSAGDSFCLNLIFSILFVYHPLSLSLPPPPRLPTNLFISTTHLSHPFGIALDFIPDFLRVYYDWFYRPSGQPIEDADNLRRMRSHFHRNYCWVIVIRLAVSKICLLGDWVRVRARRWVVFSTMFSRIQYLGILLSCTHTRKHAHAQM